MGINLAKGQGINLAKPDGVTPLTNVRMGLGWDSRTVEKKKLFGGTKQVQKAIDLDASAIVVGGGQVLETIYFGHLRSNDGSIQHTGDNLTGAGEGDDESILVNLTMLPPNVEHVVFVVNSYSRDTFDSIENAYVRVVDSTAGDAEMAKYSLSDSGPHTGMIMARLSRSGPGWSFTAIGERAQGRVAQQLEQSALAVCR